MIKINESARPGTDRLSKFVLKGKYAEGKQSIIRRSDFIQHYPKFLLDLTSDFDESMAASMHPGGIDDALRPGVDICFKDLSLAVQVAGNEINVVDHVTGRVQEKTMTALMGGSGAGKFLLVCISYVVIRKIAHPNTCFLLQEKRRF
jgi:ABC-type multidrug transport system fused ATPase/permease subunit